MELEKTLSAVTGIPADKVLDLIEVSQLITLNKNDFYIKAGDIPKKLGFVLSGLFRYVYVDSWGNEYTKAFMPEYSFLSAYSAMISSSPSYYSIEALEEATLLSFSYEAWTALKETDMVWKDLLIRMLEKGYGAKEKRERDLLLLDAETRYRQFCAQHPQLLNRVKQHQIASFLGIKPESLSRIKKSSPLNIDQ